MHTCASKRPHKSIYIDATTAAPSHPIPTPCARAHVHATVCARGHEIQEHAHEFALPRAHAEHALTSTGAYLQIHARASGHVRARPRDIRTRVLTHTLAYSWVCANARA
eukprot:7401900-Alexandrium_andersonii.AAC.1